MADVEEKGADIDVELRIKMSIHRNNVLLQKIPQPKLVKLPNGRTFYARYQRINRQTLYLNKVRIKRTYAEKIGTRRQKKKKNGKRKLKVDISMQMRGINFAKEVRIRSSEKQ